MNCPSKSSPLFCFTITGLYSLLSLLQRHPKATQTQPAPKNFWYWLFLKIQDCTQHVSLPPVPFNIFPIPQPLRLGSHLYGMENSCCTCQHLQDLVISTLNVAFVHALPPWAEQHSWAPALPLQANVLQAKAAGTELQQAPAEGVSSLLQPFTCCEITLHCHGGGWAMSSLQMRVYLMCCWSVGLIQLLVGFPAASGACMEK